MLWLALLWRKQADLNARVTGLEAAIGRAERKLGDAHAAKPEKKTEPAAKTETDA